MVQLPEYIAEQPLDTDRRGMPQPEVRSGMGEGLEKLGESVSRLGAHLMERQRQKDATKGNYAFEEAQSEAELKRHELYQDAPADGQGHHDKVQVETDAIFAKHRKDVPADKLEEFDAKHRIFKNRQSIAASDSEYSLTKTYNSNELEKYAGGYIQNVFNDPESLEANQAVVFKYIDDSPMTLADKAIEKAKYETQFAQARIDGMARKDPERAKSELGFGSKPGPGAEMDIITGTQGGRQPLVLAGTNKQVIDRWKQVQGSMGFQVPIVSAFRDFRRNLKAGGAKHSRHLSGTALDLDTRGLSQQQVLALIRTASAAGFNGIGVYGHGNQVTSVHIDIRGHKSTWGGPPAWAQGAVNDHMAGAAHKVYTGGGTFAQGKGDLMTMPPPQQVQVNVAPADGGVSENMYAQLKQDEGFREEAYPDGAKYRAGYGSDTYQTADGKVHDVTPTSRITEEDAERDIRRRVPEFTKTVQKQIGMGTWNELPQHAKDGLVNLAYNKGSLPKSVRQALKDGDIYAAANAIQNLPVPAGMGGLRTRYDAIAEMVRSGGATITPAGGSPPGPKMEYAPGTGTGEVHPAFQGMSYEWRMKQLEAIEAGQAKAAKQAEQRAKIELDKLMEDSLAAFETKGDYSGQEPTEDMFLTAYPETAYDKWKEYQVKKITARTVHSISTMDVSQAREIRKDAFKIIPKSEHAAIFRDAYEKIDAAVKLREKDFDDKVDKMYKNRGIRYHDDQSMAEGLKLRDAEQQDINKKVKLLSEEAAQQQYEKRKDPAYRGASGTDKAIEDAIKERDQVVIDKAKERVGRSKDIVLSISSTGQPGVKPIHIPDEDDFEKADPINGKREYIKFQGEVAGAIQAYELTDDTDKELAGKIKAMSVEAISEADKAANKIVKDAAERVRKERKDDPFGAANKYYDNVREAWEKAQADPNDVEAYKNAVKLTIEVQKGWGMPYENLAILPQEQADTIAAHFKADNDERKTPENVTEIKTLLDSMPDDMARSVAVAQLYRAGLPEINQAAIDAMHDKRPKADYMRLFEAARQGKMIKGEDGVTVAALNEAVRDAFINRNGDTYYGSHTIVTAQNNDHFDFAVELLAKRAAMEMNRGLSQSDAIEASIDYLLGDKTAYRETTTSGAGVDIMVGPNDDTAALNKGFDRMTRLMSSAMDKAIAEEVVKGDQETAESLVLPTEGLVYKGNIDINKRTVIEDEDGNIATEESFSRRDEDGKEVLVPTIINGQRVTQDQAWAHYKKTGQQLGKFETAEQADAYAQALHERQEVFYGENKAATDTKRATMTEYKNSFARSSTWVEYGGGYALYHEDSDTFLSDIKNGHPIVIDTKDIQELATTNYTGSRYGIRGVMVPQEGIQ